MKHANKVKKPFEYTPAAVTMADPNYLRKKFAAIKKQQEAEKQQSMKLTVIQIRKSV